ncbi:hypothetical protein DFJ77DRAFT_296666 [Powellomyces hirtus]|nr:hypothetical protein DFJ77DRAFT_296666 [Powellomyces hirtus]
MSTGSFPSGGVDICTVKEAAAPGSFAKGLVLSRSGDSIHDISVVKSSDGQIIAVTGSVKGQGTYRVKLNIPLLTPRQWDSQCSCPDDRGGICKHTVAVFLKVFPQLPHDHGPHCPCPDPTATTRQSAVDNRLPDEAARIGSVLSEVSPEEIVALLRTVMSSGTPEQLASMSVIFPNTMFPALKAATHCQRCHKNFDPLYNTPAKMPCKIPHEETGQAYHMRTYQDSRGSDYQTGCCDKHVHVSGGWGSYDLAGYCFEGLHTGDPDRVDYNDVTIKPCDECSDCDEEQISGSEEERDTADARGGDDDCQILGYTGLKRKR